MTPAGSPPLAIAGIGGNGTDGFLGPTPAHGPINKPEVEALIAAAEVKPLEWVTVENFRATWEAAEIIFSGAGKSYPLKVAKDKNFIYLFGGLKGKESAPENARLCQLPEGFRPAKAIEAEIKVGGTETLGQIKLKAETGEILAGPGIGLAAAEAGLFFDLAVRL